MECKKCACRDLRVTSTKQRGSSIIRWRRCRACGALLRTVESAATELSERK